MSVQSRDRPLTRSILLLVCVSATHVACESSSDDRPPVSGPSQSAQSTSLFGRILGQDQATQEEAREHTLPTWRIDDTPLFVSTGAEVNGDSVFFHQVTGGSFTRDGGIVVGVGGALNALWFFDSEGAFRTSSGRTGSGPGEFQSLGTVFDHGGGLVVMDIRLRRASWFSMEGDFIGTTPLQDDEFRGWIVGAFSDRSIVTTHSQNDAEHGLRRYALTNFEGEFLNYLHGPSEPPSHDVLRIEGTSMRASGPQTVFSQIGAGNCFPRTLSVVVPNSVIAVEPEAGVVYSLDRDGTLSLVHKQERRGLVTQEMVDGLRAAIDAGVELTRQSLSAESPREVTGAIERLGASGSPMPSAWGGAIRDSNGDHVWLRPADCYVRPVTERWEVIAIDGGAIAEVIVPSQMWILAVSEDLVLARTRDELGVEYIGVYPVEK